jgi:hypothetical protein
MPSTRAKFVLAMLVVFAFFIASAGSGAMSTSWANTAVVGAEAVVLSADEPGEIADSLVAASVRSSRPVELGCEAKGRPMSARRPVSVRRPGRAAPDRAGPCRPQPGSDGTSLRVMLGQPSPHESTAPSCAGLQVFRC